MESDTEKKSPVQWGAAFGPGRTALLVAVLLFALYPEVFLGTNSFFYRDFGFFGLPVAKQLRESFLRGEIPLWNPLNNCGLPFLAQWNTMVCYPLSVVFLLPLPWSVNIFCIGHLVLAGAAMHQLAHRWTGNYFSASIAGIAYAINGLTLHSLMWPNNIAALAWLPLVLLTVEQAWREGGRRIIPAAIVAAIQMLAGAPEIILLTWLLLGSLWLGSIFKEHSLRKTYFIRFALVLLLVFGLTAVQMLPFLDLLRHSQRGADFGGADWAMPKWGLANFIVPLFRCSPSILGVYSQPQQQWTSSYYLGIGILLLALLAVWKIRGARVRWLLAVALVGVALALGENTFIYPLIKSVFPFLGVARFPIKFIVLTVITLPLLAGFAANWCLNEPDELRPKRKLLFVSAVLLLLLGGILLAAKFFPDKEEALRVTLESGLSRAVFLLLIVAGFFLLEKNSGARRKIFTGFAILLIIGFDALTHAPRQNPTVVSEAFGDLQPAMSPVPRPGEARAMISPPMQIFLGNAATPNPLEFYTGARRLLYDNCNLLDGIPKVNGFFSLYLREETEVRTRLYNPTNVPVPLADFLGVSQISSDEEMFKWIPRASFMPLVTAGQKSIFVEPSQTVNAVNSANFNPRHEVYLPSEARGFITATNPADAKISSTKILTHKIEFETESYQPALVVIAQSFYHCWQAEVDGNPTKLWRANHAFQALEVSGGKHKVKLIYRDWNFRFGVTISALTFLICCLSWLWTRPSIR